MIKLCKNLLKNKQFYKKYLSDGGRAAILERLGNELRNHPQLRRHPLVLNIELIHPDHEKLPGGGCQTNQHGSDAGQTVQLDFQQEQPVIVHLERLRLDTFRVPIQHEVVESRAQDLDECRSMAGLEGVQSPSTRWRFARIQALAGDCEADPSLQKCVNKLEFIKLLLIEINT